MGSKLGHFNQTKKFKTHTLPKKINVNYNKSFSMNGDADVGLNIVNIYVLKKGPLSKNYKIQRT